MAPDTHRHPDELLDELFSTLTLLGRALAKQQVLTEHFHLDVTRMLVMRAIADSPECRAGDIAHLLGIKAPATSSLLDCLERDGFVVREHSAEDKRVVLVQLTDEGREALACAENERRRIMRERLAVLSPEEVHGMIAVQTRLIEAMAADSQQ